MVEKIRSYFTNNEKTHGAKSIATIFYSMLFALCSANEPTFKGRLGKNNTKMKIHLENAPRIVQFIETVNRKPTTVNGYKLVMKPLLLYLLFILLFILSSTAESKIYIDINAPGGRKLPLAIQLFKNVDSKTYIDPLTDELREVMNSDLEFTGLFDLIDKDAYLENIEESGITAIETEFSNWTIIGTEILIKGGIKISNEGLKVDIRLFDTIKQKTLLGRRYTGNETDIRQIAHRFADAVIENLTGKKGVFATKIFFESDVSGNKEIYVADYNGWNKRQITNNGSINLSPQWSPEGDRLLYSSYKKGGPYLYIKEIETGKDITISDNPGINIGGRWSPDGNTIALTLFVDKNPELYTLDVKTRKLKRITWNYAIDTSPTWSPDAKRLAFVSDMAGNPHIYVVDSDGKGLKRLTYKGKYNASPAWSPRGDLIAFSGLEDGKFNIYTVSPEGTGINRLTFMGSNETPSWSPDGRHIVFSSTRAGGGWSIYIMRADGSGIRRITTGKGNYKSPSWSPYLK